MQSRQTVEAGLALKCHLMRIRGRLSYLIWLDYFNLIQLVLVLVCVAETVIVHQRIKKKEMIQGMYIDKACASMLPYGAASWTVTWTVT